MADKLISINRLKAFRNEIENMNSETIVNRLDKLIEEETNTSEIPNEDIIISLINLKSSAHHDIDKENINKAIELLQTKDHLNYISVDKLLDLVNKIEEEQEAAFWNFEKYRDDIVKDNSENDFRAGLIRASSLILSLIADR